MLADSKMMPETTLIRSVCFMCRLFVGFVLPPQAPPALLPPAASHARPRSPPPSPSPPQGGCSYHVVLCTRCMVKHPLDSFIVYPLLSVEVATPENIYMQGASRSGRFRPLRLLTRSNRMGQTVETITCSLATCKCQELHAPSRKITQMPHACTYTLVYLF